MPITKQQRDRLKAYFSAHFFKVAHSLGSCGCDLTCFCENGFLLEDVHALLDEYLNSPDNK